MSITPAWENTDTNVRGTQTEVILPLRGLGEIHPAEDKLITTILRDELVDSSHTEPLWDKLRLDREGCRLHLFVTDEPNVSAIKQVVDAGLQKASELIAENMKQREHEERLARVAAEARARRAAALRDSFRGRAFS